MREGCARDARGMRKQTRREGAGRDRRGRETVRQRYSVGFTSFTAPFQPLAVTSKTMPFGSLYFTS